MAQNVSARRQHQLLQFICQVRHDIRQTEADSITNRIAELEADGYKRIQVGPGGWDDFGGWVWQDRKGRIRDRSLISHNEGGVPFHPDLLWRNGHACGICACTECGITQQPCACEKPWSDRANWGAISVDSCRKKPWEAHTRTCVPAEWYRQAVDSEEPEEEE